MVRKSIPVNFRIPVQCIRRRKSSYCWGNLSWIKSKPSKTSLFMQNAQNMNLAMHLQAWNSRFFHCIVPTNSPNTLDTYRTYILFSAWLRFYLKQENYKNPRNASLVAYAVDGPLSKENQAPHLKFERTNGKISESNFVLTSVKNRCVQLTWKLNEAISLKIWLQSKHSKEMKINDFFYWFTSYQSLFHCYIK